VFDRVCALMPGPARWIDPARAAPVSKVFAMGELRNMWRRFAPGGAPALRNYFPVGDTAIRTNPLYGRGCSTAAVQAFLLGDVFDEIADNGARLAALEARVHEALFPFYEAMERQDRNAIRRAVREREGARPPRLRARIVKSFIDDAITPASRGDVHVLRALMRGFHMHESPAAWTRRADVMARVIGMWVKPRAEKAALYPPSLGPGRAELFKALGI
jgi:flavin-dependent dehydrogenase